MAPRREGPLPNARLAREGIRFPAPRRPVCASRAGRATGSYGTRRTPGEPHTFWTDQLSNHDSIADYHPLGEGIRPRTNGEVDDFVHCVGTGASARGVAAVLKRHQPSVRVVVVEPGEPPVLSGASQPPHKIEDASGLASRCRPSRRPAA